MSNYTVKNLKDVEDVTGGRVPEVEGRIARSELDSRELGVSYFRYGPAVPFPRWVTVTASERRLMLWSAASGRGRRAATAS